MLDDMPGYNPAFLKRIREKRNPPPPPAMAGANLGRDAARNARSEIAAMMEAAAQKALADTRQESAALIASAQQQAKLILDNAERQANEVLRNAGLAVGGNKPNPNAIIQEVAEKYGFSIGILKGASRYRHIVAARYEAIARVYLARPDMSLPQIGRLFGGRDHTSILHAVRRMGVHNSKLAKAA